MFQQQLQTILSKSEDYSYVIHRVNGEYHRLDGPAVYSPETGEEHWYYHGELHRMGGPATTASDGSRYYYQFGKRHRLDGPAVMLADGLTKWYFKDRLITNPETFVELVNAKEEERTLIYLQW